MAAAPATPARRTLAPTPGRAAAPAPAPAPAPATRKTAGGVVLRKLTDEERNARASALATAKVREAEERRIAEADALRRNERDTVERSEREAAEARKREEEERRAATRKPNEGRDAKPRSGSAAPRTTTAKPATVRGKPGPAPAGGKLGANLRNVTPEAEEDEGPRAPRRPGAGPARPACSAAKPTRRAGGDRGARPPDGADAFNVGEVRERSVASFRRRDAAPDKGARQRTKARRSSFAR